MIKHISFYAPFTLSFKPDFFFLEMCSVSAASEQEIGVLFMKKKYEALTNKRLPWQTTLDFKPQ